MFGLVTDAALRLFGAFAQNITNACAIFFFFPPLAVVAVISVHNVAQAT